MIAKKNAVSQAQFNFSETAEENLRAPGYIQPHGVALVFQEPQFEILQISNNTGKILGFHADVLIGRSLEIILGKNQLTKLKEALLQEELTTVNPLRFNLRVIDKDVAFDGTLHRLDQLIVLELEPSISEQTFTFLNFYHLIQSSVRKIHNTKDLPQLSQVVVQEIRQITGLDRVMFYRFNEQGHGTVIAESKRADLAALLGLNYPATDVPEQARKILVQGAIRLISNIEAESATLIPAYNPLIEQPLDLSCTVLRGVSPCHIKYLKNMGVATSLSIPLVKDNQLWGLIACHHYTPKYLSYEVRSACEFLGQTISVELVSKHNNEDFNYQSKSTSIQAKILESISTEENLIDGLGKEKANLLDLINASGVAILIDDDLLVAGKTPDTETIQSLVTWLENNYRQNSFFQTDSLCKLHPRYQEIKDLASGLMAISLSETQRKYILWFRPEVLQTVNWAGNPQESIQEQKDGSLTLSPRQSFQLWQEAVKFTSLPWKSDEIGAALALRKAIRKITLRKADKLAQLYKALQESETREREKANQLEAAWQKLQHTHQQLVKSHTQLVQSEKMSSLGQLVAGIAHEINNPVNFIHGNLLHTQRYVEDLLETLHLYERHYPSPVAEIQAQVEEIDLEFLVEDVARMLTSMQSGSRRIRNIVQSLRNFSRLDESALKDVDIHKGLDSTLLIINHRLQEKSERPEIEIIKEYGSLPRVECYSGQLNQVFINILNNAIDELEFVHGKKARKDKKKSLDHQLKSNPQILIRTELINSEWVVIKIADNGYGITTDIINQIFDPFFTTKSVGQGTGLGLSISYQIVVERHGGQLLCHSTPGQGAEFTIKIPLRQTEKLA